MDLTIIVLSFNTKELLKNCLASIFNRKWKHNITVVVVDNASFDGSVGMVGKKFPQVKLIESDKNLGFAGGNNLGIKNASSDFYLLLNSDTEVLESSLDNLVDFMKKSGCGVGSCKLLNKDGSLQPNIGDLPLGWPLFFWLAGWDDVIPFIKNLLPTFHRNSPQYYRGEKQVGWVSGAAMIISKDVIEKIGDLDDAIFMYGEDVDYCLRAQKAGFKIGWTNQAEIIHLGGGSWKNPSLNQWLGEFRGLLYIYKKHFGNWASLLLRFSIYTFTIVRSLAFLIIGKPKVSQTYVKVLFNL